LRTQLQTIPILEWTPDSRLVFLDAHEATRRERYARAALTDQMKALLDFETAMHHPTETDVQRLRAMAHVIIETDDLDVPGVVDAILRELHIA
jgi:hypothetical protein